MISKLGLSLTVSITAEDARRLLANKGIEAAAKGKRGLDDATVRDVRNLISLPGMDSMALRAAALKQPGFVEQLWVMVGGEVPSEAETPPKSEEQSVEAEPVPPDSDAAASKRKPKGKK